MKRIGAIAFALWLGGCSDFSQHRFGGVRQDTSLAEGPPKPAPALYMPKPPEVAQINRDENVQQATFVPQREGPIEPQQQPLRVLYQRAAERHATMDSYLFRLKRREVVNGKKQPEEVMRVQVRRDPYSVHLVWLNEKSKGQEVIYVQGKYGNKMQVLLAANDPFALLGRRQSIATDDAMVRAASRYSITGTGFGSLIERFGQMVAVAEKSDPRDGTVKYLGSVQRPEFEAKLEAVHQVLPPNADPQLPKGGQRWWFFDATNGLPVLIIAHDASGEVEYYCHDHIQAPAQLDDNDFNPERVWRK